MNTNNIEVKISIPFRLNKPDNNGNIYTENAIKNALKEFKSVPLIVEKGKSFECYGIINTLDGYDQTDKEIIAHFNGYIFNGGTNEDVEKWDRDPKIIDEFHINAIGISKAY